MNIRYILLVICSIIVATTSVDPYTCQCTFSDKDIKYIKVTDGSDNCASKCFDLATIPCSEKTHTCECNGKKVKCLKKRSGDIFTGFGHINNKEGEENVRFTATDDSGHSGIVGSSTGSGSGSGSTGCNKYTGLENNVKSNVKFSGDASSGPNVKFSGDASSGPNVKFSGDASSGPNVKSNVKFSGDASSGTSGDSCDTGSTTNNSSSDDGEYYCPCSASIINVKILE